MSLKKPKILKYIKVAPYIPLFLSVLKIKKLSCKPYFWGADYEFVTHLKQISTYFEEYRNYSSLQ